jgi:hypothetical protein
MTAQARPAPRYHFQRDTRYLVTVVDDDGGREDRRLDAYQGWLAGPEGIRHRFGAHRRGRTEILDSRIAATVGPVA